MNKLLGTLRSFLTLMLLLSLPALGGCPETSDDDDDDDAADDDAADDDAADDDAGDDDAGDDDMGDDDSGDDDTGDDDMGDDDMGDDDTSGPMAAAVDCASVTADETVQIVDFAFFPSSVSIASGEVVQWTNMDGASHTVTSGNPGDPDAGDAFDSGMLASGATFCLEFTGAESYLYHCIPHAQMMNGAQVIVQ